MQHDARIPVGLLVVDLTLMISSGINPKDPLTWWLEVTPFLIAAPILIFTFHRMRLTNLVYALMSLHACVLFLGAHYTYAEVPLGFWAAEILGQTRNGYDRLGHFFQGFVPAFVAREIILRTTPLREGRWLTFLVICVCLSGSAMYELLEWQAAVSLGQSADAFLGTQGDPWDTQKDMGLALIGATLAVVIFGGVHSRALQQLREKHRPAS